MSTEMVVSRGLDLTRSPDEQWNREMMALVCSQVLKRAATRGEQIYCLAVADALALNPFIGEIYFIPSKSRDGSGPGIVPYIGRSGLVKKARERGAYYEADTVRENDRFRMTRGKDGVVSVTHSYGSKDRGAIVGAYAFLHFRNGDKPAFFWARWEEYRPVYDTQRKFDVSPWGNQESAMIEKCAMIGAGRKRLDLGNVLADGEIARVQQMQQAGPALTSGTEAPGFEWGSLPGDPEVIDRLRVATEALGWTPAKCEMVFSVLDADELAARVDALEAQASAQSPFAVAGGVDDPSHAPGPDGHAAAGSDDDEPVDAEVVVADPPAVDADRVAGLERRLDGLAETLNDPTIGPDQARDAEDEYAKVERELAAARNPGQGSLL